MLSSVFVDFGDTLAYFKPRLYTVIRETLNNHGYEFSEKKIFRAYVASCSKNNFPDEVGHNPIDLRDFIYRLGITKFSEELIGDLQKANSIRGEAFLFEDSIKFLQEVKSIGLRLVLVSNATKNVKGNVERLGIAEYFDGIVISSLVNSIKPHPRIFEIAGRYGGYPAVHLGDTYEIDYLGAKRSYVRGILVDRYDFYDDVKVNRVRNLEEALILIEKMVRE
ncbi:2-haloalkanoic acid dehalogenase [Sulfolobales archaeon HS-7]|nr:2-haloalkanoic acid dehalogenase [Sulfolobales archaeon HS-7]